MHLVLLGAMLHSAWSDMMPTQAPAPRSSRKLFSPEAPTLQPVVFNQMAQQSQSEAQQSRSEGCSCDACRGMVGRPSTEGGDHDIVSLLTCRAAEVGGACGDDFCENSCKVHISSVPDAKPRCREKGIVTEGLNLAQMREVTRLRNRCGPPQACKCKCICPEIVWPPFVGPAFAVPTPQPFFGGGASLIQESAGVKRQINATAPTSLLELGAQSQKQLFSASSAADAARAAAAKALQKASTGSISAVATANAASQKSAVVNSIVKQTILFSHHEVLSEEERRRQHRRWLQGGGNSNPKLGIVADPPVADVEVDYAFHQPADYLPGRSFEVQPKRPVAAALQTRETSFTASAAAEAHMLKGNPMPYMVLPPPPGPPPKGPPMRHDFRGGEVCPAHSPCNCYCHCKAPPGSSYMNWKPSHDQPIFEGIQEPKPILDISHGQY